MYSNYKRILGNQYFNIVVYIDPHYYNFITLSREHNIAQHDSHKMPRTKQADNIFGGMWKYTFVIRHL